MTPAERQLRIAHRHSQGWAVVEVGGRLTWPAAVQLTEFVPSSATAILLDLSTVTSIDSTGIAVLANITDQLVRAGHRLRVVVADEQLRRQLPRTVGLQEIFTSTADAISSTTGTQEP